MALIKLEKKASYGREKAFIRVKYGLDTALTSLEVSVCFLEQIEHPGKD